MFSRVLITAALAALSYADGHGQEDETKYPRWAAAMETEGYTWEPYEIVTDDGWHLTLFRITGFLNEDSKIEKHSTPVLV